MTTRTFHSSLPQCAPICIFSTSYVAVLTPCSMPGTKLRCYARGDGTEHRTRNIKSFAQVPRHGPGGTEDIDLNTQKNHTMRARRRNGEICPLLLRFDPAPVFRDYGHWESMVQALGVETRGRSHATPKASLPILAGNRASEPWLPDN